MIILVLLYQIKAILNLLLGFILSLDFIKFNNLKKEKIVGLVNYFFNI